MDNRPIALKEPIIAFKNSDLTIKLNYPGGYTMPAEIEMELWVGSIKAQIDNPIVANITGESAEISIDKSIVKTLPSQADAYFLHDGNFLFGAKFFVQSGLAENVDPIEMNVSFSGDQVIVVEVPGFDVISSQVEIATQQAAISSENAQQTAEDKISTAADRIQTGIYKDGAAQDKLDAEEAAQRAEEMLIDRLPYKSIEDLRLDTQSSAVMVKDGGRSGSFFYDPSDTVSADDSSMTIISGSRRYKRFIEGPIDVRWFGAVANYNYITNTGTDNGPFFQAAINYIFANGGGTLWVPPGRYFFSSDVYINELSIPLKILGANGYSRNYSANRVLGTSLIRNTAGSIFKINQKADGTIYLQPSEQYPSFDVEGLNFQCKNGYLGGVNVFHALRFRGSFEKCSCDGFDYFVYQPDQDLSSPAPIGNYCDQLTFNNISISGSTLGGIRLFRSDSSIIGRISFEGSATQYKYGIEVIASTGVVIMAPLFWTPNDVTPLPGANFIHLIASKGIVIMASHVERSFFNSVFYVESCVGVSIIGLETKFSRYNGLTVTGGSYGVSIRDWESNDTVKAGYYDINVPGSSDKQITYDNCRFLDVYEGVERNPNINAPTQRTVRVPAYNQTYQGSTDASITLVRGGMMLFLAAITANRTLTVPTVAQSINGDKITVINRNTTSFRWLVGNTVLDTDGTSLTYFENNKTYELVFANGQWRVHTKYPEFTLVTSTQSGNGSATSFNIPHGLTAAPSSFSVTANSAAAGGISYVTADATNIVVRYVAAPASGTNNLVFIASFKK
jgi:hypothetical protein